MTSDDTTIPSEPRPAEPSRPIWQTVLGDRLTCAFAGVIALVAYVLTMPPGVTGEDSGELIAAAWTLGIPHPPGYPLWCMAAYPLLHLLEFGSVAWRGNLVSALFGAAGVWLVAETVLAIFGRRWAAFVAALALAFSREYWQQAIIAEVYTLGAALVAAHLLLVARWTRSRAPASLYAAGFLAGLAGAHYTLNAVLVPLLLGLYFVTDLRPRRWSRYAGLLAWSLAGGLIYTYLPIRSAANPAMDWGDPGSWMGFWDVVLRRQYADLFVESGWSGVHFLSQLNVYLYQLLFEFTPIIIILSFRWLYRWIILSVILKKYSSEDVFTDLSMSLYITAAFVALSAGVILVPSYPAEYQWEWLWSAYFLPISVVVAVVIGAQMAANAPGTKWIYGLWGVTIIALSLAFNSSDRNRRDDRIAETYGKHLLAGMAPDAVYFGGGDHTIFPAVYLHVVEGERADVMLADRYGYPVPEVYMLLGESVPARRPTEQEEQRLFEALLAQTARPIYSAVPRPSPGYTRVNEGLLYRYLRVDEPRRETKPVDVPQDVFDTRGEWSNELIAYEYLAARGRGLFDSGRPVEALAALDQAADYVHGDKHALNNLGMNAAEGGQVEAASVYFQRALDSDPLFLPAALNLAKCYLLQGTPEKALEICTRLEAAGISDPAIEQMKRAAQATPESAGAAR